MASPAKRLSESLNMKITGEGHDAVVLAHGYGADQSVWDKIVPTLSKHFRVLVFDWCFSGTVSDANLFNPVRYSSYDAFADDLNTMLDENRLSSTIFVGHSMSGMVGCIASIKRPDLFTRLFLVGSSPMVRNVDGYEGGFEIKAIEQMLTILETNYDEWTKSFANFVVNPKDPSSVDTYMNCLRRMKPEVALPVAKAIFHSDHREMLGKVTTPCTIVQTTKDDVVPNSVPYLMQGWIQGKSTVEMIEMEGHYPQLTAPGKLLDVMCGILGFNHALLD